MAKPSEDGKKAASRLARRIGCSGAHQNADGVWMPCGSHEELQKISNEAETTIPKNLGKSEPPCLGCKDAKPDRGRQGTSYRKRWSKLRERGVTGINTMEGGGLTSAPVAVKKLGEWGNRVIFGRVESKELNDRQEALYEATEKLVEDHGKFDQGAGPDGAHYMPAAKNPFVKDGLVCSNCAYWVGPNGCEIVAGKLEPNAICKLWIIDGSRLKSEKSDSPFVEKGLGPNIGRSGRGIRVEPFDPDAEDGDEDGNVQDGTIHQRPKPPTPDVSLESSKPDVSLGRLELAKKKKKGPQNQGAPKKAQAPTANLGPKQNPMRGYGTSSRVGILQIDKNSVSKIFSKTKAKIMQRRYENLRSEITKKYGVSKETSISDAAAILRSVFPNMDTSKWNAGLSGNTPLEEDNLGIVVGLLATYEAHKNNKLFTNMNFELASLKEQNTPGAVMAGGATFNLRAALKFLITKDERDADGQQLKPSILIEFAAPKDMRRQRWIAMGQVAQFANQPIPPSDREILFNGVTDRYGYAAIEGSPSLETLKEWVELDAFSTAMHEMGHAAHYVASLQKSSRRGEKLGLDPIDENTDINKWTKNYLKATGEYVDTLDMYFGDKFDEAVENLRGAPPAVRQELAVKLGLFPFFDWDAPEARETFIQHLGSKYPSVALHSIFDDITFDTFRGFSETMTQEELDAIEKVLLNLSIYAQQTPFKNGAVVEGPAELVAYLGMGGVFDDEKEAAAVEKLLNFLGFDQSLIDDLMDAGERQRVELDSEPSR